MSGSVCASTSASNAFVQVSDSFDARLHETGSLGGDRRARGLRLGADEVPRVALEARGASAGERRRRAERRTVEGPGNVRRELLGRGDLALGLFGEPLDVARASRHPRVGAEHLDGVVDQPRAGTR